MNTITVNDKKITPSKVLCVGMNYAAHIEEMNNQAPSSQVFFIKPNSAITNDIHFNTVDAVHYEAEISFVIQDNAFYAIGFGLDLTKRGIQSRLKAERLPWEQAKAFDKSAVFSKFIPFNGLMADLALELHINGTLIQAGGYDLMLYKPAQILEEAREFLSFEDGDVIMTGTPRGVGPLKQGDVFVGKVLEKGAVIVEQTWTVK